MAYLQRVVNGGGQVDREYGVGAGRIDLHVRWTRDDGSIDRYAVELKVWRPGAPDPLEKGLDQLAAYLERLGLGRGVLIIFDARRSAPALTERMGEENRRHAGKEIEIRLIGYPV